jgi:Tfp pilus assembly protein PilN
MAAQKSQNLINLLPQEEFATTTVGRVLHWLLSTFRYLVITTEIIVIIAFLSRFYFDSRAADLNDEITQKQEFIVAYAPFESTFRLTQKRITIFQQMAEERNTITPSLSKVVATLPESVFLETINLVTNQSVLIEGSALSEKEISQYIANLGLQSEFESVSLTKVETTADQPLVKFNVQILLKTT